MRRSFCLFIVAALLADLGQTNAQAVNERPDPLQRAVNLSSKDPKTAERQLLALASPSAKAFLAYLYMSNAVVVPHATEKIDALMYAAAFSDYPSIVQLVKCGARKSSIDSQGAKALKYLTWNKKLSKEERAELVQTLRH